MLYDLLALLTLMDARFSPPAVSLTVDVVSGPPGTLAARPNENVQQTLTRLLSDPSVSCVELETTCLSGEVGYTRAAIRHPNLATDVYQLQATPAIQSSGLIEVNTELYGPSGNFLSNLRLADRTPRSISQTLAAGQETDIYLTAAQTRLPILQPSTSFPVRGMF